MDKKEALDILRDLYEKSVFSERKALETIVPELKYDKDELIRQSLLIYFLKTGTEWFAGAKREDIVVWLKSQGKHKFDIGDTISNGHIKYRIRNIVKNSVNKDCYSLVKPGEIVDPFLWDCEQVDKLFEKADIEKPITIGKRKLTGKAAELAKEVTPESLEEARKRLITEEEHWQDVRERAAIAALQGASSRNYYSDDCAKFAINCANALIEELKKK